MAEEQTAKEQGTRKKEPNIIVAETLGKQPIDQLLVDNPNDSFVRVPIGSSQEALAKNGLEQVMEGGKPLVRKGYAVARCVTDHHEKEVKERHEEAADMVSDVRDLELSDKTSYKKTPKKSRAKKKSSED